MEDAVALIGCDGVTVSDAVWLAAGVCVTVDGEVSVVVAVGVAVEQGISHSAAGECTGLRISALQVVVTRGMRVRQCSMWRCTTA